MRGDFRYHADKVRRAFRYGAAMRAVFDPLHAAFYEGRRWAQNGITLPNVVYALRRTRTAWRRCVEGLLESGCLAPGCEDVKNISIRAKFMRNCPPFGVLPYPKAARDCGHRFCPFCYGRKLTEGFKHIERAMYGTLNYKTPEGKLVKPLRDDLVLVGFQVSHLTKYRAGEIAPPDEIGAVLPGLLEKATEHRLAEVHAFGTVAGFVGTRVWCDMMGWITIERSGVLLCKPGNGIKQYACKHAKRDAKKATRFVLVGHPTKQRMASLFADCFRYPVALLRCNPGVAYALLGALDRKRLWSKIGSRPTGGQRAEDMTVTEDE